MKALLILIFSWSSVAMARPDVYLRCASTNSPDNGAYELVLLRDENPKYLRALILEDEEIVLEYTGTFNSVYGSLYFESLHKVSTRLSSLQIYKDQCGVLGCYDDIEVVINDPVARRNFTETGLKRLSHLICY